MRIAIQSAKLFRCASDLLEPSRRGMFLPSPPLVFLDCTILSLECKLLAYHSNYYFLSLGTHYIGPECRWVKPLHQQWALYNKLSGWESRWFRDHQEAMYYHRYDAAKQRKWLGTPCSTRQQVVICRCHYFGWLLSILHRTYPFQIPLLHSEVILSED